MRDEMGQVRREPEIKYLERKYYKKQLLVKKEKVKMDQRIEQFDREDGKENVEGTWRVK